MSVYSLKSVFAAAAALMSTACTTVPMQNSQRLNSSQQSYILAQLRPDFQYHKGMWNDYRAAHGNGEKLDQQIKDCRANPNTCSTLFQAWVKSLDVIREIPNDLPLTRAQVAISIVGELMRPDDNKTTAMNALFHSGAWLQGPWESLNEKNGLGGCGDYATLLRETLIRTGTAEQDVTLIGGVQPQLGFHFVVGLKIGGTKYILDSNHYTLDEPNLPKVPGAVIVKYEDYLKGVIVNRGETKTSPFSPLFEMGSGGFQIVGGFTDVIASFFEKDRGQKPVGNSSDEMTKQILEKYSDTSIAKLQRDIQIKMVEIAHLLQDARPEENIEPVLPKKAPSTRQPASHPSSM